MPIKEVTLLICNICDEQTLTKGDLVQGWKHYEKLDKKGFLQDRVICPECLRDIISVANKLPQKMKANDET